MFTKDTELRKVPRKVTREISLYLEKDDNWKELMSTIPKNLGLLDDDAYDLNQVLLEPKYGPKQFLLIELGARKNNKLCAEVFIDEWGTSGRRRPSLKDLVCLLNLIEAYQAADYVDEVCGCDPSKRPKDGPFARVDSRFLNVRRERENGGGRTRRACDESSVEKVERSAVKPLVPSISGCFSTGQRKDDEDREGPHCGRDRWLDKNAVISPLPHIPYKVLRKITNHFDGGEEEEVAKRKEGCCEPGQKLGSGGSGTVYLGSFCDGKLVAVKRIDKEKICKELVTRQFIMEIENVARYVEHPNVLEILGFSVDGPYPCIVYDYLREGSLLDHILRRFGKPVLPWRARLRIARETACALNYFHSRGPAPLIHRDVKSANILLDENRVAKLADYGFARFGAGDELACDQTSNVVGTHAYMAPEAFRGDVSVKLDTFGFGVVLLELVTGLPGYDDKKAHPGKDLLGFLKSEIDADHRRMKRFFDPKAAWDVEAGVGCAKIAFCCVQDKSERPSMSVVCRELDALVETNKADADHCEDP